MVILQHYLPLPVPHYHVGTCLGSPQALIPLQSYLIWTKLQCGGESSIVLQQLAVEQKVAPPPPPLPSPSPQARRSVFQWSKLVAPSKTISPLHVVQEQRTAATLARSPPNACADRPWRVLNLVLATSHYLCGTGKNYPMQYNADQTMQNMSHLYRMWNSTSLSAEYKLPAEL